MILSDTVASLCKRTPNSENFFDLDQGNLQQTIREHRTAESVIMLNDRENILKALREKPLKVFEVMRRANIPKEEACQSLLLKMRDEGLVKFDTHSGRWIIE